jgi:nuclear pore complex protein Nup210
MFILFLIFSFSRFQLDRVNVLLPFKLPNSDANPHITLNSDGTCIEWKSLDESLIRVTPQYDNSGCSKSAKIEVVVEGQNRISTGVIARASNGQQFKCDVFIDKIDNISIVTTTRQLNLEVPYEAKVVGFDSKDNSFSSLEGIKVNWEVDTSHLEKVSESSYLTVNSKQIGQTWIEASLGSGMRDKVILRVEG